MKRETMLFAARGACFLLGLGLLFAAVSRLLGDKTSYVYTADFYADSDEYEVLFFGSSHVYDGIYPLELYRESGVLSYNLGMTGETMCTTCWRVREALTHCTPKVVAVDVFAAGDTEKVPDNAEALAYLHNSLDNMPLGLTKVQALADMFGADTAQIANYLFPLAQYHSRYGTLTADDYHPYITEGRGALPLRIWQPVTQPLPDPAGSSAALGAVGGEYLRRIADLCADKGVALVLVAVPYQASDAAQLALLDSVAAFAEQNGLPFLNLFKECPVDPLTDYADDFGHLNTRGANAVSRWLAGWLTEHYPLTDRRGDPACAAWEQNLTVSLRQHGVRMQSVDLNTALMLLAQPGLGWQLRLDPAAAQSPDAQRLLAGLPGTQTGDVRQNAVPPDGAALPDGGNALLAWDLRSGEVLVERSF